MLTWSKASIRFALTSSGPFFAILCPKVNHFDIGSAVPRERSTCVIGKQPMTGDETKGYAEIVALEILFTQTTLDQYYRVLAVD